MFTVKGTMILTEISFTRIQLYRLGGRREVPKTDSQAHQIRKTYAVSHLQLLCFNASIQYTVLI